MSSPYWRRNRRLTATLLLLWFLVTLSACLLVDELNTLSFLGFPLGFYFAAQGSLILYLLIVGVYAWYMNRLDRKLSEERDAA